MRDGGFAGWIPFALRWEPAGPVIDWCYVGAHRFVEPFFDQAIEQRQRHGDDRDRLRATSAEALNNLLECRQGLPPAGFIFHASRCGSTLVAQMLASIPHCRVLSEPAILGTLFRAARREGFCVDDWHVRSLRGIVAALGMPAEQSERHFFIKFDSAAILTMPLIRRAFPEVPWVFVYREPMEILGAHFLQPVHGLPPGVAQLGLIEGDSSAFEHMPPEEFWTRVLSRRFEEALEAYEFGKGLLLNYRQLPEAVWQSLLPHFGAACSPEEIVCMRAASRLYAKNPSRAFVPDGELKQRAASPVLRAQAETLVMPHYRRLESIRSATAVGDVARS